MAFGPGFFEASLPPGGPLSASSEGVLGVGAPEVDGERLRVVVGLLRSLDGVGLMFCADRPLAVRLPGGDAAEVMVVDVEAGRGLRQVSTGSLVGVGEADGAGLVLAPVEPGFLPAAVRAVLAFDAEGRLGEAGAVERLAGEPGLWPLLPAVLRAMEPDALRRAVPVLAASACYESVFPTLRALLQGGMERSFAPRMLWGEGWDWGSAGAHTYGSPAIGPYPGARLRIGRFCSLAEEVTFILGNHVMDSASMYPFQSGTRWPSRQAGHAVAEYVARDIEVGHDVWIGYGATVLAGARIGNGALIAAGAVVRGEVAPYTIYGGNPGRAIRARFAPEIVARLQALSWWDWPDHKVDRFSALLLDPDVARFLDAAERAGG